MWKTNEMYDTYPKSYWYKLLKMEDKKWNNHKSYITILDKNTQKRTLWNEDPMTTRRQPEKGDDVFGLFSTFVQQKNEFKFLEIFCKMCQHDDFQMTENDSFIYGK